MFLKFKHFISSIDFLQITPGVERQVQSCSHWVFCVQMVAWTTREEGEFLAFSTFSQWPFLPGWWFQGVPFYVGCHCHLYVFGILPHGWGPRSSWHVMSQQRQAPPGSAHEFCKKHPHSNGCIYGTLPRNLLDKMGWQEFQELTGGVINIGGVKVGFAAGLRICFSCFGSICIFSVYTQNTVNKNIIWIMALAI